MSISPLISPDLMAGSSEMGLPFGCIVNGSRRVTWIAGKVVSEVTVPGAL